jgi:hypothetical protein
MLVINIAAQRRPGGRVPEPSIRNNLTDRWLSFQPHSQELAITQEAVQLLRERILHAAQILDACERRFQTIGRRSFADLVVGARRTVVISRNPENRRDYYGVTRGNHISLAQFCFSRRPREAAVITSAATLVHELAHVAGAPGGRSVIAECVLRSGSFEDELDHSAHGQLDIPWLEHLIRALA